MLPECSSLHSTLNGAFDKLKEFEDEFRDFLEVALSEAATELSRAFDATLPKTPTTKRGRRAKKKSVILTPIEDDGSERNHEVAPPVRRTLCLDNLQSTTIITTTTKPKRTQEKTSASPDQPQPPPRTSITTQPKRSSRSNTRPSMDVSTSQPAKPTTKIRSRSPEAPAMKKPLTPAKPPRRLRLASQSALKKITKNYLDENTDPSKLRIEAAGVISKVVGSGKARKYVISDGSPYVKLEHQVALAVPTLPSPPTDYTDVDGGDRRRTSSRHKTERPITVLSMRSVRSGKAPPLAETRAKPVPTIVSSAAANVTPPAVDKPHFRSFVQVSLSPKVALLRQPRVTCSPMKLSDGCGRGTFVVKTDASKSSPEEEAMDVGRDLADSSDVPLTFDGQGKSALLDTVDAGLDSRSDCGVSRGTFVVPLRISFDRNGSITTDGSGRRRKMAARMKARASMSASQRRSLALICGGSAQKGIDPCTVSKSNRSSSEVTNAESSDRPQEPSLDAVFAQKLFREFNLIESVVVIEDLRTDANAKRHLSLEQRNSLNSAEENSLDSGVELNKKLTFPSTAIPIPGTSEQGAANIESPAQAGSFVSQLDVSSSSSVSIISNTPSPACPSEKVVRPKRFKASSKRISVGKKIQGGGALDFFRKTVDRGSVVKATASVRKVANLVMENNGRGSMINRLSRERKPSGIGSVLQTMTRTPLDQRTKRSFSAQPPVTPNTPLESNRKRNLATSQMRSEEVSRKRQALINQKVEEHRRKRDEKTKKVREAQEKQRQMQEARAKQLKALEEIRMQAVLQKRREQEDLDRQNRVAEYRKLQEQRQEEKQRERERQREQEIELAKQAAAKKMEKELERVAREKAELERIQAHERAANEKSQKTKEDKLQKLLAEEKTNNQGATAQNATKQKAALNVTFNSDTKADVCESYDMTPQQLLPLPNPNPDNYDITDLKEDSTDDECQPRKEVPSWASGRRFRIAVLEQIRNPPVIADIFPESELMRLPQLDEIFAAKKARYNQRGSSAVWTSPLVKE